MVRTLSDVDSIPQHVEYVVRSHARWTEEDRSALALAAFSRASHSIHYWFPTPVLSREGRGWPARVLSNHRGVSRDSDVAGEFAVQRMRRRPRVKSMSTVLVLRDMTESSIILVH